ncbi:MAG TPA: ABC transporter ATP-binding protein [Xanthobacteraceae bacterium]|nr:ABC transporter ATP-binding protein [Xanthobacteraceae bacterium]
MLLEIRDLRVSYGAVAALRGLSMDVAEGSVVSILGSNGAGKSTLLNAILKSIDAKFSGTIRFNGEDVSNWSTEKLIAAGIALVPEGRQLFPDLSVMENLRMGAYLRRDTAAIASDLEQVFEMFPRLRERINQSAATMSGGEQQMVAIGRAMMSRPRLLLLDEPSLGLSPVLVTEILRLVKQINAMGVTVLLVEQNARQALKVSTHAYVLEKGQVALSDTAEALSQNKGVTDAYLGLEERENVQC